jgi:hypothetical protein
MCLRFSEAIVRSQSALQLRPHRRFQLPPSIDGTTASSTPDRCSLPSAHRLSDTIRPPSLLEGPHQSARTSTGHHNPKDKMPTDRLATFLAKHHDRRMARQQRSQSPQGCQRPESHKQFLQSQSRSIFAYSGPSSLPPVPSAPTWALVLHLEKRKTNQPTQPLLTPLCLIFFVLSST